MSSISNNKRFTFSSSTSSVSSSPSPYVKNNQNIIKEVEKYRQGLIHFSVLHQQINRILLTEKHEDFFGDMKYDKE